jgi:hypothetical protein
MMMDERVGKKQAAVTACGGTRVEEDLTSTQHHFITFSGHLGTKMDSGIGAYDDGGASREEAGGSDGLWRY